MDTFVFRMVRTRCIRQVFVWALATGCVIALAISAHRYIANFAFGPFDAGPEALESIINISNTPRYFVKVTGSQAVATGIQQITVHKRNGVETGRDVSGGYYGLLVGDKFLIVKSAVGMPTTVEGELTPIRSDLDKELFNNSDMQAARSHFYPFYLNDDSFREPGYYAIAGFFIFAFLFVKFGFPKWKQLQDPSLHPLIKRVSSWGDPIQVAKAIEDEALSPQHKLSGWLLTETYLIQRTFFSFDVLRFLDLLWVYKRVTSHSVNFIPTGKTYTAVLHCYGGTAEVKGREKKIDGILTFVTTRAPWVVMGYSKETSRMWEKTSGEFCAAVDQRRNEFFQSARFHR